MKRTLCSFVVGTGLFLVQSSPVICADGSQGRAQAISPSDTSPSVGHSETPGDSAEAGNNTPDAARVDTGQTVPDPGAATPDNSQEGKLSRWLDLNILSLSLRDRTQASYTNFHYFDFGQQRSLIDGKVKLDGEAKYAIHFHISSGHTFTWAFADVINGSYTVHKLAARRHYLPADGAKIPIAGAADRLGSFQINHYQSNGWQMYTRQLYFSAAPIKQVEFQFGSFSFAKGFSSEITTYDEDGYMAGERLRILDPKHLLVDEISVTFGYEGDFYKPNFFTRGDRLTQSNYHQFLIAKRFSKRVGISADYTGDKGIHIWRQGFLAKVPEVRFMDSARFELYQRTNAVVLQGGGFQSGSGFAFTGTKTIAKRIRLEGGYANIDKNYGVLNGSRLTTVLGLSLNADTFNTGKRAFTRANVQLTPYFSLFGFFTHLTESEGFSVNRQGFNFGGTLDFKEILSNKLHLVAATRTPSGL